MSSQAVAEGFDSTDVILGPDDGRPRIIHTMVRVTDLDSSLRFYVEGLGMKVLERLGVEAKGAAAVFVGYDDDGGAPLELVHCRGNEGPYTHGTGYGHVAVSVVDVPATFAKLEAAGAEVIMRPDVLVPGGPRCAFIKDPDGYAIEIVEP